MKPIEKLKTQRTIDRIQRGDFNDEDVEVLILRLRAYSRSYKVFWEVANFVAHNDVRDQGLANESIEYFYLSMRYINDYIGPEKTLDLVKGFPSYIVELLRYQLAHDSDANLKKKLKKTRQQANDVLRGLFKEGAEKNIRVLAKKITKSEFDVLNYLLGFIKVRPAFTPQRFMLDLFGVLRGCGIDFRQGLLELQRPKIMLSIGLLLHMTNFKLKDGAVVTCGFHSDFLWVPDDICPSDEGFGKLSIFGECEYVTAGNPFKMCYSMFDTELNVADFCHDLMFRAANHPENHNVSGRILELHRPLQMIEGLLAPI